MPEKYNKRLNIFDIIKGGCILLIILTHYGWSQRTRQLLLFPYWVDMAVPIFMVVMGYLYAYISNGKSLKDIYKFKSIVVKAVRFIIPFSFIWLIELFVLFYQGTVFTIEKLMYYYLTGGIGPGSYYFPVMLQMVLLLPLIYITIFKFRFKGLMLWAVINLLFEVGKTLINLDPALYRLCSFRYLFVVAYGVLLFVCKDNRLAFWHYFISLLGAIYIFVFNYMCFKPFITNLWTNTSMFACCYIIAFMKIVSNYKNIHENHLELLGRASFNIFLMQMFYYWAIYNYVNIHIAIKPIQLIMAFVFSIVMGIIFYKIENPLTKKFVEKIRFL